MDENGNPSIDESGNFATNDGLALDGTGKTDKNGSHIVAVGGISCTVRTVKIGHLPAGLNHHETLLAKGEIMTDNG